MLTCARAIARVKRKGLKMQYDVMFLCNMFGDVFRVSKLGAQKTINDINPKEQTMQITPQNVKSHPSNVTNLPSECYKSPLRMLKVTPQNSGNIGISETLNFKSTEGSCAFTTDRGAQIIGYGTDVMQHCRTSCNIAWYFL